jgi:hypothetical protein
MPTTNQIRDRPTSPSYSRAQPNVRASAGLAKSRYRGPRKVPPSELIGMTCTEPLAYCEHLERCDQKCGWHGDELERNDNGRPLRCGDCLEEDQCSNEKT